ncbi:MAG: baseplate J/gp47 family protein [Deltaproteobacteria bacterium]|nr:baseplate J/gp47 family protein [Deltaproteobacteria bacterium]
MSESANKTDLTRWNRSGLKRLSYVDGNAATFLETLRDILHNNFQNDWGKVRLPPPFDEERLKEENADEQWLAQTKNDFLTKQYNDEEKDDIVWALMRVFSRSCHVLAQHIDAHANETFLRTATEWEDIRKMVAMLGYEPVGATSAVTWLVIKARGKGTIKKGLQVRHRPLTGEKAVIFETLEDVEVDEAFNKFTVDGADSSPKNLGDLDIGSGGISPWQASPKAPVKKDESVLILENDAAANACAASIENIVNGRLILNFQDSDAWKDFEAGDARLKTSPRFKRKPWINGPKVRRSTVPHGLAEGSVIAWRKCSGSDTDTKWKFAEVERADAFGIELRGHSEDFRDNATDLNGPAYRKDDIWPDWFDSSGPVSEKRIEKIEVLRAVKLTGTYTVPAGSEAEKMIGELEDFTAGQIFSVSEEDIGVLADDEQLSDFELPTIVSGGVESETIIANEGFYQFLIWLFGKLDFSDLFPTIKIQKLVKLAAMFLVEDAKIPSTGKMVYEAFLDILDGVSTEDRDWNKGPPPGLNPKPLFRFWVNQPEAEQTEGGTSETKPSKTPYTPEFQQITGELWYLPKKQEGLGLPNPEVLEFANKPDGNRFFFNGNPNGVDVGDWVAVKFNAASGTSTKWYASKIKEIEEPPAGYEQRHAPAFAFRLDMSNIPSLDSNAESNSEEKRSYSELLEIQADYRGEGRPEGHDVNKEKIDGLIVLKPCPKKLAPGSVLLATDGGEKAQQITVSTVIIDDCVVGFKEKLEDGFTQGNLKLYGNIVLAGHGERQSAAMMGSGVGADRKDFIILERTEVSTIPDSRLAQGASEDLVVRVQGEEWRAVSHLDEAGPADRAYMVTTTETGYVKLKFGDGRHGRALPPGTNNVTIDYRVGAGRRGCVEPYSLDRLVHPHPLVESVVQPFKAKGGEDMEPREQMRENAPASLLALERAVSVSDFEQLAIQHRSIIKARAFYTIGGAGRFDLVTVVAVMTEGDEIDKTTMDELTDYLQRRAVPTVRVEVQPHKPISVELFVQIRVDSSRYKLDKVQAAVKSALAETFSIERRQIGEPLYLSEVYAAVEEVTGVEDSICNFKRPYGGLLVIASDVDEICFIATESAIECPEPTEYEP